MAMNEVSRSPIYFSFQPRVSSQNLKFAIGAILTSSALLGLGFILADRCIKKLSSLPKDVEELPCECVFVIRMIQVIPVLIVAAIGLDRPAE